MTSLTLYDISGRFYDLFSRYAADETLTEQEAQEQYDELAVILQQKTPGVVAFYQNMQASIDAIKAEETRLAEMRVKAQKAQEKYKQYIHECMNRMNIVELTTPLGSLKIAKNPMSVDITDINQVPAQYKKTSMSISADKVAIKKHFTETGELLPGCKFITDKTTLNIK